ncbi:MAG: hypothetical protein PHY40_04035 [Patescibacteria group bacterium]|jgi:hypothetical protein|nr:hypothetical protein [Patescibacteria group bacterium]
MTEKIKREKKMKILLSLEVSLVFFLFLMVLLLLLLKKTPQPTVIVTAPPPSFTLDSIGGGISGGGCFYTVGGQVECGTYF